MLAAYAFVITLLIPSFGGEVKVTVQTPTPNGCWAARRAAQAMLRSEGVRAEVSACAAVEPPKGE